MAKRLDIVMDRDESIGWYWEVIRSLEQDTIAYEPFTDQTAIEFDRQQQFFDNIAYFLVSPGTEKMNLSFGCLGCLGCHCLPNLYSGNP